ncbi:hypothetical protein FACS1894187_16550 [Synergistales bacterium]|nr:hypothetical protein FACS1894187_16550 [Synergistales bacterium]
MFEAFAKFAKTKDARLLILGEGPLRPKLEELLRDLRMEGKIAMPGWAQDPFAYMVQADVFLLSSLYEGLPTVLVEALACGRTIVSTRCQYGPEEILDNGRYGYLVPVGDADAMTEAMQTALNCPFDIGVLQKRAEDFSFENAISAYESIIQRLHGVTDDCPCRADNNKRVS